ANSEILAYLRDVDYRPMRLVPLDCLPEAALEIHAGTKAELPFGLGRIQLPSRLPIGLTSVPPYPATEAGGLRDDLDQLKDTYLRRGSKIHWVSFVIAFRSKNDSLGCVLHV